VTRTSYPRLPVEKRASDTLRGMFYAPFAIAASVQSVPGFGHRVVIKAHVVFI